MVKSNQILQHVNRNCSFFGQVEQRSELVDIVTKLAKEEAAAEKGAAAAAKADAAAISFADMPEDVVTQTATKTNAAAALKQVKGLDEAVVNHALMMTTVWHA